MTHPRTLDAAGLPPDPRRTEATASAARGLKDAAELRGLVLKHPDLAERLTLPPLDIPSPDLWNGYIPPLMTCAEGGERNKSPRRPVLIDICAQALAREFDEQSAEAWKWRLG